MRAGAHRRAPQRRGAQQALLRHRRVLGGCDIGRAVVIPVFRLTARWMIHTVAPKWTGYSRRAGAALVVLSRIPGVRRRGGCGECGLPDNRNGRPPLSAASRLDRCGRRALGIYRGVHGPLRLFRPAGVARVPGSDRRRRIAVPSFRHSLNTWSRLRQTESPGTIDLSGRGLTALNSPHYGDGRRRAVQGSHHCTSDQDP